MTIAFRYKFEHGILPQQFHTHKMPFITFLLKGEEAFCQWVTDCYKQEGLDFPYQPGDYAIDYVKMLDDVFVVVLRFPEPEAPGLCHSVYFAFDSAFSWQHYFTLEKTVGDLGEDPMLCAWIERGHANYGPVDPDQIHVLEKCLDILKKTYLSEDEG